MKKTLSMIMFVLVLMLAGSALASSSLDSDFDELSDLRATTLYTLVSPYYEASIEVAVNSPEIGRDFTDHKIKHAMMVVEKSIEFAEVLRLALEAGTIPTYVGEGMVGFSAEINPWVMAGASIFHDTGMCGIGYCPVPLTDEQGVNLKDEAGRTLLTRESDDRILMIRVDRDDFKTVRTYHSLNSAMFVLLSREALLEVGYTDLDVDMMAAACQAHSKSSSGVRNISSRADWAYCFDMLDALVYAWNTDQPEKPVSFDRTPFETPDSDALNRLVSITLSLRVGDVSRDSEPDAEVQTGETVHVDRSTLNDMGGSWEAELENAVITIGVNNDPVPSLKGRQVHAGEQNIVENNSYLNQEGIVTHQIVVEDGCSAPKCTQISVNDHLGEFGSAPEGKFAIDIRFRQFEDTEDEFFRKSWDEFRIQAMKDYHNITIVYPWDQP